MVQTIATYWEKQIRIYGVSESRDLGLLRFTYPSADTLGLGRLILEGESLCSRFELVSSQAAGPEHFLLNVVGAGKEIMQLAEMLVPETIRRWQTEPELISPVAAIYFHGPHFQDRFGIAYAVEKALAPHDVSMFFCGCTGTSVYLIVSEKDRKLAGAVIREHFLIPDGR